MDSLDQPGVKPAAQYLRMSTDHQRYSIDNQAAAIRAYAESHDLQVVRSFIDAGKSGLSFEGRAGLQALVQDAVAGHPDYDVLLIYDVSRWGRFQDIDEGAYYEFLCRRAGLRLVYVNERFDEFEGSAGSILKALKRVMAGEYSRELSSKVFFCQCRAAARGHVPSGPPVFGLRRQLIDDKGVPRAVLEPGQRKAIHSDRTTLIPGPAAEVAVVREIFDLFVRERLWFAEIADRLNAPDHPASRLKTWRAGCIGRMIRNEKYLGWNVFNKVTKKLHTKVRRNPKSDWVIVRDAFDPLVDEATFLAAQSRIAAHRPTKEMLLDHLRTIIQRHGKVTTTLIASAQGPAIANYQKYFGTLSAAYAAIGYDYLARNYPGGRCRRVKPKVAQTFYETIGKRLKRLRRGRGTKHYVLPSGGVVSARLLLACRYGTPKDQWRIPVSWPEEVTHLIVGRVGFKNRALFDVLLLPKAQFEARTFTTNFPLDPHLEPYSYPSIKAALSALLDKPRQKVIGP